MGGPPITATTRRPALRRPRIFYGWYIVGAALVAQFVGAGTQAWAAGVLLKPMTTDLGWSREAFSAVQTVSTFVSGGMGLLIGVLVDRRGPRALMLIGALIAGIAMCATSLVHELWQFYLIRGITQTIGMAMIGGLVVNVTVAKWFVARRGMAIAMASLGTSLAGVLLAPLLSLFVAAYDWRAAWIALGVTVWVLMIPAAFVIRSTPERYGLTPDGMSADEAREYSTRRKRASASSEVQWTRHEAVRTPTIWIVILAYGVATIGIGAMLLHTISFLDDQGFSHTTSAFLFSLFAWATLLSKPCWGWLMDRFHARFLSAVGFTISAVFILGLVSATRVHSELMIAAMLVGFGLAIGGTIPLQETVWASYFGRQHLGEIRSVAMPFSIIFGAGGPWIAGALYDRSGSYNSALISFAMFQFLGAVLVLLARPPRRPLAAAGGHPEEPAPAPLAAGAVRSALAEPPPAS
ncbi:MAG: MFS transporter [Dehalococcoidia bacterium]|nr:MFS transporter [Dehalococcoidia bacterium]